MNRSALRLRLLRLDNQIAIPILGGDAASDLDGIAIDAWADAETIVANAAQFNRRHDHLAGVHALVIKDAVASEVIQVSSQRRACANHVDEPNAVTFWPMSVAILILASVNALGHVRCPFNVSLRWTSQPQEYHTLLGQRTSRPYLIRDNRVVHRRILSIADP